MSITPRVAKATLWPPKDFLDMGWKAEQKEPRPTGMSQAVEFINQA